jgi:transketolase
MDEELKKILHKSADTIRALSFEGVQKANSGHPGLPMGCAEFGAYLYGHVLRHNPKSSDWLNRDRFILSAGHGSMFIYSCLHLAGFKLSIDDLKQFRQLHSITPGHPEFHETDGVETTTGPLGQGVGNAVGQALGIKLLAATFNTDETTLFDSKVYCLAGDGCLMEGVSGEASSFAGHLGLNNFILFHDANKITLDGPLSQCSSEDVTKRYEAYGFDTYTVDGNDLGALHKLMETIESKEQKRPIYVRMETVIGKGSPNKEGTHKVHGSPLGPEECELTKKALGLPEEDFYVPQAVSTFFEQQQKKGAEREKQWNEMFTKWKSSHPQLAEKFKVMRERKMPENLEEILSEMDIEAPVAGRKSSQAVLQKLGDLLPFFYGGSADLSGSDCTMMKQFDLVEPGKFSGRNIKFGIREFAMGTMAAGLFQTHMILPYVGTFFTFSDYMRNAVRLAALSHFHVIYQWTHDSIFLGEDGPTHQPVEHIASLRAMPNLHVWRPADTWEVRGAWLSMLEYQGPSCIILTRQNLPDMPRDLSLRDGPGRGAYIVKKEKGDKPDYTLMATGSEVSLAMDVAAALEKHDKSVRVVSMPCWELFESQPKDYRKEILCGDIGKRVAIEAGVAQGWHKWVGCCGTTICMESFGASAPISDLQEEFGFNVDAILQRIL